MKNTQTEEQKRNERAGELLADMESQLTATVRTYEALLDQCQKLAESMGLVGELVVAKVMPKTTADRTDTARIAEWFDKQKHASVAHLLELEAEDAQDKARGELIAALKLTPEQLAILGVGVGATPAMKV